MEKSARADISDRGQKIDGNTNPQSILGLGFRAAVFAFWRISLLSYWLGCSGQVLKAQSAIWVGSDTCDAAFPFNDYQTLVIADIADTVIVRILEFCHIMQSPCG